MLNKIIDDINQALENDCLLSALALALTLPDVCGKAEWPKNGIGQRYIRWFDDYVGVSEHCTCTACQEAQMPYLSGEVVYCLRNNFLHQTTLDVESTKIKASDNHIDEFILVTESKKDYVTHGDSSSVITEFRSDGTKRVHKRLRVNVRHLCYILTTCAKSYYEMNKEKFGFLRFSVVNWDEEMRKQ